MSLFAYISAFDEMIEQVRETSVKDVKNEFKQ